MSFVVRIWVSWEEHCVVNQVLKCVSFADVLDEFGDCAAARNHHKTVLRVQQVFHRKALVALKHIVDLFRVHVTISATINMKQVQG